MWLYIDYLRDLLRLMLVIVLAILTLAALPFVFLRIVEVLTGQDGEPRITASYWAERGYDTTGNSLPPVADGKEKP